MECINEGWLEAILQKQSYNERIVRVTKVVTEEVVTKGNNYTSDMIRVKMEVVLGSGRKSKRTLIMKCIPSTEIRAQMIGNWGLFKKEIRVYTEILPLMEELLEEIGDHSEPLWGQCLAYHRYNQLVLEDLKESGYVMVNKRKGLDLDHSKVAMRSLAKFHALSVILIERGQLKTEEYEIHSTWELSKDMLQGYHNNLLGRLADMMESTWEPEWKEFAPKIRGLLDKSMDMVIKGVKKSDESKFHVVNHGDYWSNNMMFKHIPETDTPSNVRLIDLQLVNHNIPALDLQYFFNTSVTPEVKESHMEELLQTYHQSLLRLLDKLGYTTRTLTMEELKSGLEEKAPYGLIVGLTMLPMMLILPEDTRDIEEALKDIDVASKEGREPNSMFDDKVLEDKEFKRRIRYIIQYAVDLGVI